MLETEAKVNKSNMDLSCWVSSNTKYSHTSESELPGNCFSRVTSHKRDLCFLLVMSTATPQGNEGNSCQMP